MAMINELFNFVRQLGLPQGDYAIFGSGPLIVRGIIPFANDLDIICRGSAWHTVLAAGQPEFLDAYETTIVSMANGAITFGSTWGIGAFDIDKLIDTAEVIDGLPFVRVRYVIEYKTIRSLPKDLAHIEASRLVGLWLFSPKPPKRCSRVSAQQRSQQGL